MKQVWLIPYRVESLANKHLHWTAQYRHKKACQLILAAYFRIQECKIKPPCKITLCRIAPRPLDEKDNLPSAFKNIVDYLGLILMPGTRIGQADGTGLIDIAYEQRKGAPKEYALEITIEDK